jgi:hypothetical protein
MARKRKTVADAAPAPAGNEPGAPPARPYLAAPPTTVARAFEIYGARSAADLIFFKSLGFTQVIADAGWLAEDADALGLDVVLANWWAPGTAWSTIEDALRLAQRLTRLVSVNMADEPLWLGLGSHPPGYYVALREQILRAGYDLPLSLTNYGPDPDWPPSWIRAFADYFDAIDLLRIDPYPVAARKPFRIVADWIDLAFRLMGLTNQAMPLTVVVEAWDSGLGLPEVGEIRVMAYLALFSGADTVSFFRYDPGKWIQENGFTEGFAAMIGELTGLAREFAGATVYPVIGGDGIFQAEVFLDGDWTCFTVNTLGRPNGFLAPLQVLREEGRCPRPSTAIDAPLGPLLPRPGLGATRHG